MSRIELGFLQSICDSMFRTIPEMYYCVNCPVDVILRP